MTAALSPPSARDQTIFTLGPDVIAWIELHCVYPADEWMGRPFILLPWQRRFINRLYECDAEGNLTYRWALLGIPKKNGKTSLAAALGLYHLFGDPFAEDPWVVCGASSDTQADLVFGAAKRMVENSPTLSKVATLFKSTIVPRRGPGKMERVAAAKGKNDGKNISFALLDELHEWAEYDWTVLTNGTAGRRRAQIVQITTAGFDLDTVCGREYEKGRAIERGEVDNPTYLFEWYGAPEGADYSDPEVWRAANPSYGTLVTEAQLRDQFKNKREEEFRRYFLNQWIRTATLWLPHGAWMANVDEDAAPLVEGEDTWVGWDASTKRDSTAVAAVQWIDGEYIAPEDETAEATDETAEATDEQAAGWLDLSIDEELLQALRRTRGRLRVEVKVWERPRLPDGTFDETWRLPIAEVEDYVRWLAREFNVLEISYDPAFITWSASTLEVEGLPMVEFPQTDTRMVPATQLTYEMALTGRLPHNGDPLVARHVEQTATASSRQGGTRIAKNKARAPMDASVAIVMAVLRAVKGLAEAGKNVPGVW